MFCKYCGKQLQENEKCDCEGARQAQAAQQVAQQPVQEAQTAQQPVQEAQQGQPQNANAQYQQGQPLNPNFQYQQGQPQNPNFQYQQYQQGQPQNWQQNMQGAFSNVQSNPVVQNTVNLIKNLFKRPVGILPELYAEANKTPQYLIAAIYAVALYLFGVTALLKMSVGGKAFGEALLLIVIVGVLKAVYAGLAWGFSDKSKKYTDALALFCASALPEICCMLIAFVFMLFGWSNYLLILSALFAWFFAAAAVNLLTTLTVLGTNKDKAYWMFMIATLVLTILVLVITRSVITSMIESMMESMMGSLWSLY